MRKVYSALSLNRISSLVSTGVIAACSISIMLILGIHFAVAAGPKQPLYAPVKEDPNRMAWFYDLTADRLLIRDYDEVPPIRTVIKGEDGEEDSEGVAVKVFIFACGECPQALKEGMSREEVKEVGAFIGYFETFTWDAKEKFKVDRDRLRAAKPDARPVLSQSKMLYPGYKISDLETLDAAMVNGQDILRFENDKVWLQGMSPKARVIQRAIHDRCDDGRSPRWCSAYR